MSYITPNLVVSPKKWVSNLNVIYDGGEHSWSLARMTWDGRESIGLRWNGGSDDKRFPGIGNPQSRGVPTWFILPDELSEIVVKMVKGKKSLIQELKTEAEVTEAEAEKILDVLFPTLAEISE